MSKRLLPPTDKQIKRLIAENRNTQVTSVYLIPEGENNWAYKVDTDTGTFLLRIAKNLRVGLAEKLQIIEGLLLQANIPHSKLISRGQDSEHAPFGYMIFEFIEGQNARSAISQGRISFENFHAQLGTLLKQIHDIHLPKFGPIPFDEARTDSDYLTHNIQSIQTILQNYEKTIPSFPQNLAPKIKEKISEINYLKHKLKPVLCHTDPPPNNCILKDDGQIVLIDWDNALSTIWVVDLADLTYSGSHLSDLGSRKERREKILQSLLSTHGTEEFTYPELLQVEKVCHILKAVHSLPYHYHTQNNHEWFWKTTKRLIDLCDGGNP